MSAEAAKLYEISPVGGRPQVPDRLPFVLPDFNRHAWTSEAARSVWEPRIDRVVAAWSEIEWLSVAKKLRECWLGWLRPDALDALIPKWEAAQLSAIQLQIENAYFGGNPDASLPGVAGMICVVVGTMETTEQFRRAWVDSDHDSIGYLLGYPRCCRKFFRDIWVEHKGLDTTWAMAENTPGPRSNGTIRIEQRDENQQMANILWRWRGVRAVPHLPCRFDCAPSIEFGKRLLDVGREAGFSEEVDWIREILSWPVEWSALHGIAEVKSPLMKLATRTDATSAKWVVQWSGTRYPEEGPIGLHFPYQPPKKLMLTDTREFQRGLAHASADSEDEAWRFVDNGFSSGEVMAKLHSPIVELAREALAKQSGRVLDLGCGNGMLLSKICAGHENLIPCGVDRNAEALEHVKHILPGFENNFAQGDLFDIDLWSGGAKKHALVLLMLARLREVPKRRAVRLLDHLRRSGARVLAYVYPDSGELEAVANEFDLELEHSGPATARFLKASPTDQ